MTDLSGKTVLVTGGGTGLGAALARAYADAGATVWIAGRRDGPLAALAADHDRIHAVTADVTDEASVAAMFEAIGPCDIVIANAGASASAPFPKTDLATWQQMLDVNLTGAFLTLREGARHLKGRDWGRLIAVASTAGLKGYPYVAAYTAAKHGVIGMVKATALEMAKTGVTVNALCPGFLDTEMTERSIENIMDKTGMSAADARAQLEKMSPQRRLTQRAEVVAAAMWLTGPGSEGITGQAISISGGEA
ncbi:NAD(P)-dependent dehydrogenase, short-chain alcohol dehydrogenase family [Roseivivax lentus]|uniref:NAD(P)-dependent dehydrogenase, short-chain alcohol dehydrogenase family n=1 Tax=Roseivivax lentus TaxID=633194 RepID=A0A1N7Q2I3_9RHOB|nr:SDR family NAD(P)-dependent oxidoreductase [Roseivivax lentus]SIT17035.1 NAD(P)-dependent dehydrogenase, short-chain alcohol dehydrogenase family [Roseivivax lentus]